MPIKLPSGTGWIDYRYTKSFYRVLVKAGSVEALPLTQYVDDERIDEHTETKNPAPGFSSCSVWNPIDVGYVLTSLADKIGITPQELDDNSTHYYYVSKTTIAHPDPWLVATPNPWVEGGVENWWYCYREVTDEHWQACYSSDYIDDDIAVDMGSLLLLWLLLALLLSSSASLSNLEDIWERKIRFYKNS